MSRYRTEEPPNGYGLRLKLRDAVAYYRPLIEQVQSEEKEALDRMVRDFRIVFYFGVLEQILRRIGLCGMFEESA